MKEKETRAYWIEGEPSAAEQAATCCIAVNTARLIEANLL
jgi:hypothetical protein